jgi:hypothetical protein
MIVAELQQKSLVKLLTLIQNTQSRVQNLTVLAAHFPSQAHQQATSIATPAVLIKLGTHPRTPSVNLVVLDTRSLHPLRSSNRARKIPHPVNPDVLRTFSTLSQCIQRRSAPRW